MRMETLAVGKAVVHKVLLESLELQDMVRRKELLKGHRESQEQQSLDLKEQLPEQVDKEAMQDLRVHPRRLGLRSVRRRHGEHHRAVQRPMEGNGLPERAPGLRRHRRHRVGGVRRRRPQLRGRALQEACRT